MLFNLFLHYEQKSVQVKEKNGIKNKIKTEKELRLTEIEK